MMFFEEEFDVLDAFIGEGQDSVVIIGAIHPDDAVFLRLVSPMHEARRGVSSGNLDNPAYCEMGRPSSGEHVVYIARLSAVPRSSGTGKTHLAMSLDRNVIRTIGRAIQSAFPC
ncbi:hypothetical protein [Mesorhizobium sp. M0029]|uniref:hypothetical protein n=1 Tax=Mesorhizobium sp. M0029 TaxID=2956850 RepID=UPI00333A0241